MEDEAEGPPPLHPGHDPRIQGGLAKPHPRSGGHRCTAPVRARSRWTTRLSGRRSAARASRCARRGPPSRRGRRTRRTRRPATASRPPDCGRYQWFSVCLVQRIADCAPPASCVGDLERSVVHLVVVDAERHEADALGLLAGERVAREQVVLRLGHAAQQRPADRGVVAGGDAEAGVAVDDPRGPGRPPTRRRGCRRRGRRRPRGRGSPTRSASSS